MAAWRRADAIRAAPQRASVHGSAHSSCRSRAHPGGGSRAPSASNWHPWNFVVVTERSAPGRAGEGVAGGGTHIARSAATIAIVAATPEDERQGELAAVDVGQATANMMITVADLWLGSCSLRRGRPGTGPARPGLPAGWLRRLPDRARLPAERPLRPTRRRDVATAGRGRTRRRAAGRRPASATPSSHRRAAGPPADRGDRPAGGEQRSGSGGVRPLAGGADVRRELPGRSVSSGSPTTARSG